MKIRNALIDKKRRGSAFVFGTGLALVLVVLGVSFVFLMMYMGGQNETKNATDAGILNTAKRALDQISIKLNVTDDSEKCFADVCTDKNYDKLPNFLPETNLRRINRIWAKALLMNINAEAAQHDGNAGSGPNNATSAYNSAKSISDKLADKLTNQGNLHGFFDELSQQNSVRMIGTTVQVKSLPGANWQTSEMDRLDESNIVLSGSSPFNLPPGFNLNAAASTKCARPNVPANAQNWFFLKGYQPISANGHDFWQVPFQYDQKPHLVSKSIFDSDKVANKALAWDKPIPNAYSAEGQALKAGAYGEKAMSWALSNPRQPFKMCAPHSFVKIHLDDMKAHFYFYPFDFPPLPAIEFGPAISYGYLTDTVSGAPMPAGGILCATVTPQASQLVGTDVVGRTLNQIIFSIPTSFGGGESKIEAYLTNRMNEMICEPGVTMSTSDMHNVLSAPEIIPFLAAGKGEKDFYVFSTDGKTIKCLPDYLAIPLAPWLATEISHDPDGTESKIVNDAESPAPMFSTPIVVPDPFCTPFMQVGWGSWHKDLAWRPGTGYNSCLGTVRVKRWTEIMSWGACNPL
ncbi:MAG: hypothetical protein IPJ49_24875 [Candidatus Obscuribacter sp.]|nr:hypothetical protein [Candidatus Obscuribacter sp.]